VKSAKTVRTEGLCLFGASGGPPGRPVLKIEKLERKKKRKNRKNKKTLGDNKNKKRWTAGKCFPRKASGRWPRPRSLRGPGVLFRQSNEKKKKFKEPTIQGRVGKSGTKPTWSKRGRFKTNSTRGNRNVVSRDM